MNERLDFSNIPPSDRKEINSGTVRTRRGKGEPNIFNLRMQFEEEPEQCNLASLLGGIEIERVLRGQKLWRERPKLKRMSEFQDQRKEGVFLGVVDPDSFYFFEEQIKTDKKPSVIVVITDPLHGSRDGKLNPIILGKHNDRLMAGGVLFCFETRKPGAFDRTWREERLKDAGFVETGVMPGLSEEFVVWRGRLKRKAKRTSINFLDFSGDKWWRESYIMTRFVKVIEDYKNVGYRVLNKEEIGDLDIGHNRNPIFEQLSASKNFPNDISRMESGFGVIVQGVGCDCVWEIRLNGTHYNWRQCRGGMCQCQSEPGIAPLINES